MSFRARLTILSALAVAAALVAASLAIFVGVRETLSDRVDRALEQQAQFMRREVPDRPGRGDERPRGGPLLPPGARGGTRSYVQLVDRSGNVLRPPGRGGPPGGGPPGSDPTPRGPGYEQPSGEGDAPLRVTDTTRRVLEGEVFRAFEDQRVNDQHMRVLTVRLFGGNAAQIALSLEEVDATVAQVTKILVAALLGSVLAAIALGLFVTRVAVRPMRELERAVEEVGSERDLSVRIPATSDDEIGRLGRRFNEMLDRLSASRRQQQQLVEDASHELRTPLTSIMTNMEVLELADELTPPQRELVRDVTAQVGELSTLATSLVELAHGNLPAGERRRFELALVVEESVERARRIARGRVGIEADIERGSDVEADDQRVASAVDNVLSNAVKFSPDGGTVHVRLRGTTIEVTDEGPGIPAADREHVFDRFYRTAEARSAPGAGLGLAIVRSVVDEHGGSASIGDGPGGRGTTVTLTLPAA